MKMELTKPCRDCPFRTDVKPYLRKDRAEEISNNLLNQNTFSCHKMDRGKFKDDPQHCAGALIMLEKMEQPNQLMRIWERLGFYDRRKLKMDSPVFENTNGFIEAQRDQIHY